MVKIFLYPFANLSSSSVSKLGSFRCLLLSLFSRWLRYFSIFSNRILRYEVITYWILSTLIRSFFIQTILKDCFDVHTSIRCKANRKSDLEMAIKFSSIFLVCSRRQSTSSVCGDKSSGDIISFIQF